MSATLPDIYAMIVNLRKEVDEMKEQVAELQKETNYCKDNYYDILNIVFRMLRHSNPPITRANSTSDST